MIQYDVAKILLEYMDKPCKHKNTPDNKKVAVAVETRDTFFFPLVIKNFVHRLGPKWNFHFFVTTKVRDQLKIMLPDCDFKITIITHPLVFHIENYSSLLKSTEFWQHIKEDTVMVYQSDCILLRQVPEWVEDYDMIGAPCGSIKSDTDFVMNGGLSVRRRKVMEELSLDLIDTVEDNRPEDVYFHERMMEEPEKYNLPIISTASTFASEAVSHRTLNTVIGIHGTDKYFTDMGTDGESFMRDRFNPFRLTIVG